MDLIDRGYLRKMLMFEKKYEMSHEDYLIAKQAIDDAPAVEAIPVVRCRDCQYWNKNGGCMVVTKGAVVMSCTPDYYCAAGERRGLNESADLV